MRSIRCYLLRAGITRDLGPHPGDCGAVFKRAWYPRSPIVDWRVAGAANTSAHRTSQITLKEGNLVGGWTGVSCAYDAIQTSEGLLCSVTPAESQQECRASVDDLLALPRRATNSFFFFFARKTYILFESKTFPDIFKLGEESICVEQ